MTADPRSRRPSATGSMSRTLRRAVAVTLLLAGVAAATTIRRITLVDAAEQARTILVGTVRATECVAGDDDRGMIYTDVEVEHLDVWKGRIAGSSVTYRLAGGVIGDTSLTVPGMPKLVAGTRYVLFVDPDADDVCPLVGWTQGQYEVRRDPKTGVERMHDAAGHPVFGFDDGKPVLKATKERPRALTLVEMQVEVTRALETAARRAVEPSEDPDDDAKAEREQPPAVDRDEDER